MASTKKKVTYCIKTSSLRNKMNDSFKVQDIIQKLKKLNCPLVSSGDNAWIEEILFTPNFERYLLMEWFLLKFGFNIPKGDECQNSSEVKAKNLLSAISTLGLCKKDDTKVIQGETPMKEQLALWTLLVDILWKKCCFSAHGNDATASTSNDVRCIIAEQFEIQSNYVNKLCNSVSFKHLFKEKVQLFPPRFLKESREACSNHSSEFLSLEQIKSSVHAESNNPVPSKGSSRNDILCMNLYSDDNKDFLVSEHEGIPKLEDVISASLNNLQNHSKKDFKETCNDLKLYLSIPSDDNIDLGPEFKAVEVSLGKFLELKKSLSLVKSSEMELRTLNSELLNVDLPSEPLSDSLLGEYISIMKEADKR